MTNLTLTPLWINSLIFSAINIWWEELNALAMWIFLKTSSWSSPNASAICSILSGLKVFSVSMNTHSPSKPPFSLGNWTVTANSCEIWLLPDPNSPNTSVIAWVSIPPPINSSTPLLPVVIRPTSRLLSITSNAVSKSIFSALRAASITFSATPSPISAFTDNSLAVAVANLIISANPASLNFSAVFSPTLGKSSSSTIIINPLNKFIKFHHTIKLRLKTHF